MLATRAALPGWRKGRRWLSVEFREGQISRMETAKAGFEMNNNVRLKLGKRCVIVVVSKLRGELGSMRVAELDFGLTSRGR